MAWSRERQKEDRQANPDKYRKYEKTKRDKNLPAYREKCRRATWKFNGVPTPLTPRPEVCDCCGGPPGKRALHVDHDHVTGVFRGWLCHNCNLGIGRLGDTIEALDRAIKYLQRAQPDEHTSHEDH